MTGAEKQMIATMVNLGTYIWLAAAALHGWRRGLPYMAASALRGIVLMAASVALSLYGARMLVEYAGSAMRYFFQNTVGSWTLSIVMNEVTASKGAGLTAAQAQQAARVMGDLSWQIIAKEFEGIAARIGGAFLDTKALGQLVSQQKTLAAAVPVFTSKLLGGIGGLWAFTALLGPASRLCTTVLAPLLTRITAFGMTIEGRLRERGVSEMSIRAPAALLGGAGALLQLGWYGAWAVPVSVLLGSYLRYWTQGKDPATSALLEGARALSNAPLALAGRSIIGWLASLAVKLVP